MKRLALLLVIGIAMPVLPARAVACMPTPRPDPSNPVLVAQRAMFGFHDEELVLCSAGHTSATHLSARLWVPAACVDASCPAVLIAHGFGFNKEITLGDMLNAAQRGMVVLSYDVRGQGQSGGQATLLGRDDIADQAAILAWMHAELDPTELGVYGISQGGALAWMAAIYNCGSERASSFDSTTSCEAGERWVDAIAPAQGPTTLRSFDDGTCLVFSAQAVPYSRGNPTLAAENVRCLAADTPLEPLTEGLPELDLDVRDLWPRADRIDVPVYAVTSFNDRLVPPQDITHMFELLDAREDYDEDLRLAVSNDGHGTVGANFAVLNDVFAWFAGLFSGAEPLRDARVAIEQEWAGNAFRLEHGWPIPGTSFGTSFLSREGVGELVPAAPASQSPDELYNVPVLDSPPEAPFFGGVRFSNADTVPGVRSTFRSGPATETLEITGVPTATIWVSGSGRGQIHVSLAELTPDGDVLEFARARAGLSGLTSAPTPVELTFNASSVRIDPGNRLLVSITPTDVGVALPERGLDSVFLHHDAAGPSSVSVPVVAVERVPPAGDPPSGASFTDDPLGAICAFFGNACP